MISNCELTRIAAEFRDRGFGPMRGAPDASLAAAPRRNIAAILRRLPRAARILEGERRGKRIIYRPADGHGRRPVADMVAHVGEAQEQEEGLG